MTKQEIARAIERGEGVVGLELGSTRIKAVLVGADGTPLASGSFDWENSLVDGVWTYSLEEVWQGVQENWKALREDVAAQYNVILRKVRAMGFSAMMHGYLAFDENENLLVPFRTWRNTMTEQGAAALTALFGFNIPQRWSVAHLEQAILNGEPHVGAIRYLTTLAGYVHWKLTGRFVLGVGDASGMFPIDSHTKSYNREMVAKFDARHEKDRLPWKILDILPQVLLAGEDAGTLTEEGAKLLDPTGTLEPGCPLAPPEGDAGTGMAATNSVRVRTGNISAGTSVFSMIVLEKPLEKVHTEIDVVTTPSGADVAMVHCNNCTSDLNAWAGLLCRFAKAAGFEMKLGQALDILFTASLSADRDLGGLSAVSFLSGEPVAGLEAGRPMFLRAPDSSFTLENFGRTLLYSALATLRIGNEILREEEHVAVDTLFGHGGFFKAKLPGQRAMAAALGYPISVMETAGEGGPWGMALLALYRVDAGAQTLEDYLEQRIFSAGNVETVQPVPEEEESFDLFLARFKKDLAAEKAALL